MENVSDKTTETILDKLSLLVIDIEPGDLPGIAQIHECFKQLGQISQTPSGLEPIIKQGINIAEQIIMEEQPFKEGMDTIKKTIQTLQDHIQGIVIKTIVMDFTGSDDKGKSEKIKLIDDEIIRQFLQRQPSFLEEFEGKVLALEQGDKEAEKEVRRYLHTWKGEAGVLALTSLQEFIHTVESRIADSNGNNISVDGLFAVKDYLSQYFTSMESGIFPKVEKQDVEKIYQFFGERSTSIDESPAVTAASVVKVNEKDIPKEPIIELPPPPPIVQIDFSGDTSLLLDFIAESQEHLHNAEVVLMNLETNPEDKENLNAIFRVFHTIKGVAGFVGLHEVAELSHKAETMLDQARKGEIVLSGGHIDVTFEAVDILKAMIENIQKALEEGEFKTPEGYGALLLRLENPIVIETDEQRPVAPGKKVGEILIETGKASSEIVEKAIELQKRGDERPIGEILVKEGEVKPKEVVEALRAQSSPLKDKKDAKASGVENTVKVSTNRLDSLIDMVGELVIANSMVAQEREIQTSQNQQLTRNVTHLGKITRELQELSMSLRMVSVKATFQKMARLVRDLAKKNNKIVNFVMNGEDTELDRNVVEEIGDPLMHMVRNSVDHGIELPENRVKAGKPECGTVQLNAYHRGGNVVIELVDDGKGLDKERILQKAIGMGIVKENEKLSEQEIHNLIFHPGLSTAKKITDVSGRGVGMDVVKKNIDALRGHVDIKSAIGKGTTISLVLPLTLAIIDGMIVKVGKEDFIIPTISVVESFRPIKDQITDVAGNGKLINLRGRFLPLYHLGNVFTVPNAIQNPCEGLVVVIAGSGDNKPRAIVVDQLVGQQQVVIKSIGKGLGELIGISGGAILGGGKVGLILDPAGVVRAAELTDNNANHN